MRSIATLFLVFLSLTAWAQVEVTLKKIGPDHVRRMMDLERFQPAREMALQCARDGDAWCKFYAAHMLAAGLGGEKDPAEAFKLFIASAEQGNPAGQATLGNMYHNGLGVDRDKQRAVSWWEKSAENCNAWAQNAVAHAYYDEVLVPQDLAKAYFWISLARHYEHPHAQQGVVVVRSKLPGEQIAQIDAKVQKFIATSGCGDESKPIVNFEP